MEKSLFSSALSPTLSPPLTFMSSHYWSIIFLAWKISAYYFRIAFLQWCVPWEQADLVQTGKNENVSVLLLRKEARHWRLNITNAYWSENYALLGYCATVLCLCSRETNLQQLLPLPVCIRHASCKEKRSRNSKLVAVLCFTNNAWWGGSTKWNYFVYLVFHARCQISSAYVAAEVVEAPSPCSSSCPGQPAHIHPSVSSLLQPSGTLLQRQNCQTSTT